MYQYRAEVVYVVDGDTIDVAVDLGFKHTQEMRLRLAGIDTWELRGEERAKGLVAKEYVLETFANMDPEDYVVIRTKKDKQGKYGRYIATVLIMGRDDTELLNLNDALVEEGHARRVSW